MVRPPRRRVQPRLAELRRPGGAARRELPPRPRPDDLRHARAFVGWPPLMLFDEPTSGLDPINEGQVLDLIIRARDLRGISSILVTKQLHQIPYLATHRAVECEGGVEVREAAQPDAPDPRVLFSCTSSSRRRARPSTPRARGRSRRQAAEALRPL